MSFGGALVPYLLGNPTITSTNVVNPTGAIIMWPTSTPPSGYLKCDGSAISRLTYAPLFSVIGTSYGSGNGASVAVTSWFISGGSVTITLTNPYIVAGNTFTWDNGAGSIYSNLVATILTNSTTIVALVSAGNSSGTGGNVTLQNPTTFNLPNAAGKTIRGYDGSTYTLGGTGGADSYALTPANIASHKHNTTIVANGTGASAGGISTSAPPTSGTSYTTGIIYDNSGNAVTNAGSNGSSFSLVNAYLVLTYCIKT